MTIQNSLKITIFITIIFISDFIWHYKSNALENDIPSISLTLKNEQRSQHSVKTKRYLLYDVNPGEGFNLRRDIFIRIAPLIASLNKENPQDKWILVLPPWKRLPHWIDMESEFPWSTYFQVDKITEYIPAIEFNDYLEEYGLDHPIDVVFQLQHFAFDEASLREWKEEIQTPVPCESQLNYILDEKSGLYKGSFWKQKGVFAKKAECTALRGQASTLYPFLQKLNPRSVMLDRAEVILWDNYGGKEWWKARMSLQFAQTLKDAAGAFLQKNKLLSSVVTSKSSNSNKINASKELDKPKEYIGVHLRRKDFVVSRWQRMPSLKSAAVEMSQISNLTSLTDLFLATDAHEIELDELEKELKFYAPNLRVLRFPCKESGLSEGECAIVEQIICSYSNYFVGTDESTFTFRIFEEREILGFEPSQTYHYLCQHYTKDDKQRKEITCKKPTQWRIPFPL